MPNFLTLNDKDDENGAKAIALVRGGDLNASILYLHTDTDKKEAKKKKQETKKIDVEITPKKYEKDLKALGLKPAQRVYLLNKLQEAMEKGTKPDSLLESEGVKDLYRKIISDQKSKQGVSFELPDDSQFEIVPNCKEDARDVLLLAGSAGVGKSYQARAFAEKYRKLWPDRKIYLISKLKEDETLDKMKGGPPERVNIESLADDPLEYDEFSDCLAIFDDYDTLDTKTLKAVQKLIDDICILGRHTRSSIIIISHYLTNYKATRLILMETQTFIVYPQGCSFKALKYLLGTHVGLDNKDIMELKSLGSRWVAIHKNYPQWMVSEHSAKLLNQ
jgi:hypothetical protein